MAVVLTGLVPWQSVANDGAPLVNALKRISLLPGGHRLHWVRLFVLLGAITGMISSIMVGQYGQARIWFAMSRDRLLPDAFSRLHPRFRTPAFATWVAGILVAIPAGLFDVGTLAEMTNIGTLFAFVLVSAGVIILRYKEPIAPSRLPRAIRPRRPHSQHPVLHSADGRPARAHLGALLRLAHHWPLCLHPLQPQTQRVLPGVTPDVSADPFQITS